ncbi:aldolase/citrate lyase family protein [Streptomyces sp. NPDC093252]|uniref:HpcH/HpaI aldolase family protein n=1 Tax=Streptomyces sp. NPDC093252 TaxID=3154980 RepID=UPI00343A9F3C
MTQVGFWLTDGSTPAAEIVAETGYDFVVLDIEHGMFDLETLDRFIPLLRNLGLKVFAKVREPSAAAIQQPLDFGATGVIVPHVTTVQHAEELARFAKYPPRGERSMAGGRPFRYGPWTDERMSELDSETLFFPLVEHPLAVRDIDLIAGLENVDGFQMGPGDLSLLSGRGAFSQTDADWADIERCVDAMQQRGKPWMYPAWTETELNWALSRNAPYIIVSAQYAAFRQAADLVRSRTSSAIKTAKRAAEPAQ